MMKMNRNIDMSKNMFTNMSMNKNMHLNKFTTKHDHAHETTSGPLPLPFKLTIRKLEGFTRVPVTIFVWDFSLILQNFEIL